MGSFEFHSEAEKFDLLNAIRLAELSKLAYEPLDQSGIYLQKEFGFTYYKKFDCGDTQAFLVSNEGMVVLAFRGTSTLKDLGTDGKFKFTVLENKKVHFGFNQALDCVWADLYDALCGLKAPDQPLWVTGHSLGGALATLAVDRLTDERMDVSGLYTYGQPRVGDRDFAKQFDVKMGKSSFRFVNDEDVVTRVPPPPGFKHIGKMCFFDNKGVLYLENTLWHWFRSVSEGVALRTAAGAAETAIQNPNGPGDHNLDYYIRNLLKNYDIQQHAPDAGTFKEYIKRV